MRQNSKFRESGKSLAISAPNSEISEKKENKIMSYNFKNTVPSSVENLDDALSGDSLKDIITSAGNLATVAGNLKRQATAKLWTVYLENVKDAAIENGCDITEEITDIGGCPVTVYGANNTAKFIIDNDKEKEPTFRLLYSVNSDGTRGTKMDVLKRPDGHSGWVFGI
jgi:hypothetical protein